MILIHCVLQWVPLIRYLSQGTNFFFYDSAGFSISFWPFKAAQRERELYQSTILGICPLECICIQPDQGAYLRVSDQILATRDPTEAFIFMYDVFCTRKDKDFLFQSWASSSSSIRAERETILQGNSHVCTTERNTLTHIREWPFTFIYILMAERL